MTDILRTSPPTTAPDTTRPDQAHSSPAKSDTGKPGSPTPGVPKQRDAYFDNVKFFLILLVVVGHFWEVFKKDSYAADAAYSVVYGFHMPLFVFVSGYFSRGFMRSTDKFRSIFPTLIIPYAIFNVLYRGVGIISTGEFQLAGLVRPQFLMWFVVALVFWRLSAPLWPHLRFPVTVAVFLSLVGGSWSFNSDSTLCRTAGLLPFFVLGLTIRREHVQALRDRGGWTRWAGAAVLVAALPIAYVWERGTVVPKIEHGVRLWNQGYEHMGFSMTEGMAYRFLAMIIATVLGVAFLTVIPRGRAWFTGFGTRTMYIYLLHGLVVKSLYYGGVFDGRFIQSPPGLILVTIGALTLGVLLGTPPVARVTRLVVEPKGRGLLKPSQEAA
ncbi:acyltransferase family protein [Actinomadura meridiana]|uniref:Acyltransferase family protein n=1 Tax=Actinomadura meridiana TaxID=559626 RepID=A0ABP8C9H4_9ACTN